MVEIIAASEKDIPIIEDILLDAVLWLDSAGLPLWRREDVTWERLSKSFTAPDFLIALIDGTPAACMALVDHDPLIWPDVPKGESLFIHKLAVKRFAAGKGLSDALISRAKEICMDREITSLRLDCHRFRPKLRAVYERNGFICTAEKIIFGKFDVAFYECEVRDTRHLYHYYEKSLPPFRTVTSLPFDGAERILLEKQAKDPKSTNPNIEWFLKRRYDMEKTVREKFIEIGGKPVLSAPVYCTLGANKGLNTWFQDAAYIRIPIDGIDIDAVSFTYGDMFAVFNKSLNTGEEWWEMVYDYRGILKLIEKYGYPEDPVYDMKNWIFPKDRPINQYLKYIEAHVWGGACFSSFIPKEI